MRYDGSLVVEALTRILADAERTPKERMDLVVEPARLKAEARLMLEEIEEMRRVNEEWEGDECERPDLHPWDPMGQSYSGDSERAMEEAILEERRAERLTRLWHRMSEPQVQSVLALARELGADEDAVVDLEYRMQG